MRQFSVSLRLLFAIAEEVSRRPRLDVESIQIAIGHSQGVTMQYVALSLAERAAFTTRLAIAAYEEGARGEEPR